MLCVTASIYSLVAMAFERHRAIAMVRSWQITLSGGVYVAVWIQLEVIMPQIDFL